MTTQDNISDKADNQACKKRGRKRTKRIYTVRNIYPEMSDEERAQAEREAIIKVMKIMEEQKKEQKQKQPTKAD